MKTNKPKTYEKKTHGRNQANPHQKPLQELRRAVLSCLLWENQFYEKGNTIATRIAALAKEVSTEALAALAVEARSVYHLRHVPLLLLCELVSRGGSIVGKTITDTIQRPDEMGEFITLYWRDGRKPLSAQMKKGIANAFTKFGAYQLGKYDGKADVKLSDVLRLVHPTPKDEKQAEVFGKIRHGTLETPDTWETELSAGKDKKETFTRLLKEGKLGYLALLRNLRNMEQAGVDRQLVETAILARKGGADKVFPYRFLSPAKNAKRYEHVLDQAMVANLAEMPKLPGKTVLIVDVSGSMNNAMSGHSDVSRIDAACALAAIIREVSENAVIYATAGDDYKRIHATDIVPARHGMALMEATVGMRSTLGGGGIFLTQVMNYVYAQEKNADRIIVITDEQDCGNTAADHPSKANAFGTQNYLINVLSYDRTINFGKWTQVNGFSDAVVTWIIENEKVENSNNQ